MALFSSSTKETTTTRTAPRSAQEQSAIDSLFGIGRSAGGQIGDLSGLASGGMAKLSPDIIALLESIRSESVGRETAAQQRTFEEGLRGARNEAATRGQTDSSTEAMYRALAGRSMQDNIADIESRGTEFMSTSQLNLPFQLGKQMLDVNSLLYQMATSPTNAGIGALLQDRLNNTTSTKTTENKDGLLPGLVQLGSSLSGMGAFNPLMSLFSGGGTGSLGNPAMYSTAIGPTLGGAPQGNLSSVGGTYQGPGF